MKVTHLLIFVSLVLFACSKSADKGIVKEEDLPSASKVTATRTDSILVGDWLYLGSSVAFAPYYILSTGDSVILTFKGNNTYVDSSKSRNADYGKFMIIDSVLGNGDRVNILNKVSSMIRGVGAPEFFRVNWSKDTLVLEVNNQGIINSKYIKLRK